MNTPSLCGLPPPVLDWRDGQAINREHDDGYFSRAGGLDESRHVFLRHNDLARRFGRCQRFCIGELGFGTGLNFLLSWALWDQQAAAAAQLDYVAVERAPLSAEQMRRALAPWPALADRQETLLARLPRATVGFHSVHLRPGLRLILLYADVAKALAQLEARVDAWFLDGFAPSRNPAMWAPQTFRAMTRLSKPGASFATYSAAGPVRRGLQSEGWSTRKARGFGHKRDMLYGHLQRAPTAPDRPWRRWPQESPRRGCTVIGSGLVGAVQARTLADAGWRVRLIGLPDSSATRIPAFVVRPYPERVASPSHRIYAAAWALAAQRYPQWCPAAWQPLEDADEGRDRPAAQLDNAAALRALLEHPRIQLVTDYVESLWLGSHGWQARARSQIVSGSEPLVLCSGAWPVAGLSGLALQALAGQSLSLPAGAFADRLDRLQLLKRPDSRLLGASFRPDEADLTPREADTQALLREARTLWPEADIGPDTAVLATHTALRIASPDHLPLIGPAPDEAVWRERYADLRHGRPARHDPPPRYRPWLWINLAHGSRGASMAPLAAELILSGLEQRPWPLEADLVDALMPGRFVLRALRRAGR